MALGLGKSGTPMAEGRCYQKLRSLEAKGCIELIASERTGTRIRLKLPHEIPGVISVKVVDPVADLIAMDFFEVPENRPLILEREQHRYFYCLRSIDKESYVIEHVVPRPYGNNSYKNVVAAYRQCNNRKGSSSVEDFLRTLYRENLLSSDEVEDRLSHLEHLRAGELKPVADAG